MTGKGELVKTESDPEADLARLEADANLVEKRFGDGEPYEYERVVAEAMAAKRAAKIAFLDLGVALLRMKAHEQHGKFIAALDRVGINPRTAQLYMRIAHRFADTPRLRELPASKLDMLAALGDGEIKALERGEIGHITVDDVDRMSRSELAAALRAERDRTGKRLKAAEQQYHQTKDRLDYLEHAEGVSVDFSRLTGAAGRAVAELQILDLTEVEQTAIRRFVEMQRDALDALYKRACPDEAAARPDQHIELGKAEQKERRRRAGVAELPKPKK